MNAEDVNFPFQLKDMTNIHNLVEKVVETQLNIKLNISVLTDLKAYYQEMPEIEEDAEKHIRGMHSNIKKFDRQVQSAINDLSLQLARSDTLLKTLEDRKSLVSGSF
jgi:hypothetical protein